MRRLRITLAATAAFALAGAGAAQAAPAPWVGPAAVSAPANGTASGCDLSFCPGIGAGDVALTPAGDLVAAWTRRDAAGSYHVEAATRPAGGSFSAPVDLGAASLEPDPIDAFTQRPSPVAVGVDANGHSTIVWLGPAGGKRVVKASIDLQSATNVSSPGQDASDVKLAVNPAGEAVAAWVRSNGANTIAQAALRSPGGTFAAAQDLSATGKSAHDPAVAIGAGGDAVAAWASDAIGNGVIQAASRAPGGAFGAFSALSLPGTDAQQPDVAVEAQGRATVVWQRGNAIQSAARTQATFGAVETLAATNFTDARPKVAVDGRNTAVAVWLNNFVLQSAARPSGGSFGAIQDVSAPNGAAGATAHLAMDATGTAQVVWQGGGQVLSARRPAGEPFGTVDALEQGGSADVALDGLGNAAVVLAQVPQSKAGAFTAEIAAFDGSPPTFKQLTVTPTAMSARTFDVWSPVTTTWEFGDGTSATGDDVAHAFGPGAFIVTAHARDRFGREATAARSVSVAAPPEPAARPTPPPIVVAPAAPAPRALANLVGNNWDVRDKRFKLTLLVVRAPIPKGAVAEVRCQGKGCPFKAKRSTTVKKGEINLLPLLAKQQRRFTAGMTVEVRLTAPGVRGRAVKFVLKRNRVPRPQGRTL